MRLLALLLLIFTITIGMTIAIVAKSDAPFIYYFSPSERAIIIEQSDGADRHVLIQQRFQSENASIRDIRWSPTSEWLVWTVVEDTSYETGVPNIVGNAI